MTFPKNTVRVQAFHHQGGFEAKRKLAADFAGPGGRLATMEDIVDARLATRRDQHPWHTSFVTDSWLYYGLYKGKPYYVFAHGGGPEPIARRDLRSNQGKQVAYGHDLCLERDTFKALVAKALRTDAPNLIAIEMLSYERGTVARGLSTNQYTYDIAKEDPIVRAYLGRNAEAFLARHRDETHAWLKGHVPEQELDRATVIRDMVHVFSYRSWERMLTDEGYAPRAYPLMLERAYFFHEHDDVNKHILGYTEICATTEEDFMGSAQMVVGIRDKDRITGIMPEFRRLIPGILREWEHFVEPPGPAEDPNASKAGDCYVLRKGGRGTDDAWFTQYLDPSQYEKGESVLTSEPHFPVTAIARIKALKIYEIEYPRTDWRPPCVLSVLDRITPPGANAVHIDWYGDRRQEGTPNLFQVRASFWKVEVDTTRRFRRLAELRQDFDFVLDRCQHLGLLEKFT